MSKNPFHVGDFVIYDPSLHGRGSIINTDLARLQPGNKYRIAEIIDEDWVVMEGFEDCVPSGLYWSEYKAAPDSI